MDVSERRWRKNTEKNAVFQRLAEVSGRQWKVKWWPGRELNPRHADFQSAALPTELPGRSEERRIKQERGPYVNEPLLNQPVRAPKMGIIRASAHSPWVSPTPRQRRTSPSP